MASIAPTLSGVSDLLRELSSAGSISLRAVPATLSLDIDESAPGLRARLWRDISRACATLRLPSRIARRLVEELTAACASGAVVAALLGDAVGGGGSGARGGRAGGAGGGMRAAAAGDALREWTWAAAELCARLASAAGVGPTAEGSSSADGRGGARAGATTISRVEDAAPVASGALFFCAAVPAEERARWCAVEEGTCAVTALVTAAARLVLGGARASAGTPRRALTAALAPPTSSAAAGGASLAVALFCARDDVLRNWGVVSPGQPSLPRVAAGQAREAVVAVESALRFLLFSGGVLSRIAGGAAVAVAGFAGLRVSTAAPDAADLSAIFDGARGSITSSGGTTTSSPLILSRIQEAMLRALPFFLSEFLRATRAETADAAAVIALRAGGGGGGGGAAAGRARKRARDAVERGGAGASPDGALSDTVGEGLHIFNTPTGSLDGGFTVLCGLLSASTGWSSASSFSLHGRGVEEIALRARAVGALLAVAEAERVFSEHDDGSSSSRGVASTAPRATALRGVGEWLCRAASALATTSAGGGGVHGRDAAASVASASASTAAAAHALSAAAEALFELSPKSLWSVAVEEDGTVSAGGSVPLPPFVQLFCSLVGVAGGESAAARVAGAALVAAARERALEARALDPFLSAVLSTQGTAVGAGAARALSDVHFLRALASALRSTPLGAVVGAARALAAAVRAAAVKSHGDALTGALAHATAEALRTLPVTHATAADLAALAGGEAADAVHALASSAAAAYARGDVAVFRAALAPALSLAAAASDAALSVAPLLPAARAVAVAPQGAGAPLIADIAFDLTYPARALAAAAAPSTAPLPTPLSARAPTFGVKDVANWLQSDATRGEVCGTETAEAERAHTSLALFCASRLRLAVSFARSASAAPDAATATDAGRSSHKLAKSLARALLAHGGSVTAAVLDIALPAAGGGGGDVFFDEVALVSALADSRDWRCALLSSGAFVHIPGAVDGLFSALVRCMSSGTPQAAETYRIAQLSLALPLQLFGGAVGARGAHALCSRLLAALNALPASAATAGGTTLCLRAALCRLLPLCPDDADDAAAAAGAAAVAASDWALKVRDSELFGAAAARAVVHAAARCAVAGEQSGEKKKRVRKAVEDAALTVLKSIGGVREPWGRDAALSAVATALRLRDAGDAVTVHIQRGVGAAFAPLLAAAIADVKRNDSSAASLSSLAAILDFETAVDVESGGEGGLLINAAQVGAVVEAATRGDALAHKALTTLASALTRAAKRPSFVVDTATLTLCAAISANDALAALAPKASASELAAFCTSVQGDAEGGDAAAAFIAVGAALSSTSRTHDEALGATAGAGAGAATDKPAQTAIIDVARALMPLAVRAVTTGSVSDARTPTAALHFLRAIASSPRVLPLARAELSLLVVAAGILADEKWGGADEKWGVVVSDAERGGASASGALPPTPADARSLRYAPAPELASDTIDVDIGAWGGGGADAGRVGPPIVSCGGALAAAAAVTDAALSPRAPVATATAPLRANNRASPTLPFALWSAATWLCASLLRHRRDAALKLLPAGLARALGASFRFLVLPREGGGAIAGGDALDAERDAAGYLTVGAVRAAPLTRAAESLARAARPARFHVVALLADACAALAGGPARPPAPPHVRATVEPALFALFDAAGAREQVSLNAALLSNPRARRLAKDIFAAYETAAKYTG